MAMHKEDKNKVYCVSYTVLYSSRKLVSYLMEKMKIYIEYVLVNIYYSATPTWIHLIDGELVIQLS
jgi:hypothetical protein